MELSGSPCMILCQNTEIIKIQKIPFPSLKNPFKSRQVWKHMSIQNVCLKQGFYGMGGIQKLIHSVCM